MAVTTVTDLLTVASSLSSLGVGTDDAELVDRIRALEVLKAAAAAAQACAAAALDASQRAAQAAAGVPAAKRGQGVGAQVALARRESPHRGGRHLGLAKALVHEMPHTLTALQAGRISEWRATLLVRETAVLTRPHRTAVDREVAGDPDRLRALEELGDRALVARARQVAYRLDPRSVVERAARAVAERCVTVRPAPDTMAYLTALLPARDAIAVHTALGRAADTARSTGVVPGAGEEGAGAGGAEVEPRGRGQLMADLLVARVLQAAAPDGAQAPGPRDVAVRLVMTDRALVDGDAEPAHLDGYGPVPAPWARGLVAGTLEDAAAHPSARVFVTRLLTDRDGALVAMDSRARTATRGLADLVRARDGGTCRTPCCDAPARHVDHVRAHADGGRTRAQDLQGLCEACNYAKQAPGWRQRVAPVDGSGRHVVTTTTPTGHTYTSTAPPLPGTRARPAATPPGRPPLDRPPLDRPPLGRPPMDRPPLEPLDHGAPCGLGASVDLYVPSPLEGYLAGRLVLAA